MRQKSEGHRGEQVRFIVYSQFQVGTGEENRGIGIDLYIFNTAGANGL